MTGRPSAALMVVTGVLPPGAWSTFSISALSTPVLVWGHVEDQRKVARQSGGRAVSFTDRIEHRPGHRLAGENGR